MTPVSIDVAQEASGLFVAPATLPDQQQRPLETAWQLLHKGTESVTGHMPLSHGEIEAQAFLAGGDRDGARDREPSMAIPTVMAGRVPPGSPGAAHRGRQPKAGLVNKGNRAALAPSFVLSVASL